MVTETGCDPTSGTCTAEAAALPPVLMLQVSHQQVQVGHQAKEERIQLPDIGSAALLKLLASRQGKRAICFDDDASLIQAAADKGRIVNGCADLVDDCDHKWGGWIRLFCPETCHLCNDCVDNDTHLIEQAAENGLNLTGCSDEDLPCDIHEVKQLCPETCGSCKCDDDDADLVSKFEEYNIPVQGCRDVGVHCRLPGLGALISHYCPKICGRCSPGSAALVKLHVSRQAKEESSHWKRAI